MINLFELTGPIQGTDIQRVPIKEPFTNLTARFAPMTGTVLLMSGGDMDCSRYHILGIKPWLTLTGRKGRLKISSGEKALDLEADPFDALRTILNTYHNERPHESLPFTSGLMGYLAYDLKDHIEELPRTSMDDLVLPDICLFAPSIIVVHDKRDKSTWLCTSLKAPSGIKDLVSWLYDVQPLQGMSWPLDEKNIQGKDPVSSNMTRREYIDSVKRIKTYILSGDVYQVNFAQRFETNFSGDPFGYFLDCYRENPAPFFSYINAGSHHIVSTSPERFLKRAGPDVETRPIKGTRPRGRNMHEDLKLKNELRESEKDDAELSMIVDLMRNDLGKVCEGGSVRVSRHKRIEKYQNVFHMVSIIRGRMAGKYDSVDLIKAAFPGGSITGCPKIRAMEIIDELEPNRRHCYTGSIGYISFHDTMDLSIGIRTAVIYNKKIFFSVGGGIVHDSIPLEEYNETLHKGKTLMAVKRRGNRPKHKEMAWVNGMIRPVNQAHIKVSDLGLQYGLGFFETIRFSKGAPCYLSEHIDRFNKTWLELFGDEYPDLSWDRIIDQVVDANMLKETISSIKIIASWGSRLEPPYDHSIIVTARPYINRLSGRDEYGLRLATYPYPRQTPLADHKTLNYAYYYLAGKWAREHGADEALIMNPDQSISETNSANIIIIKGRKVIRASSPHSLQGIMEGKIIDLLSSSDYMIEKRPVVHEDLFDSDRVLITNSMIGAAPVISVDDKTLADSQDICKEINILL